jgi:hypothetical protein
MSALGVAMLHGLLSNGTYTTQMTIGLMGLPAARVPLTNHLSRPIPLPWAA